MFKKFAVQMCLGARGDNWRWVLQAGQKILCLALVLLGSACSTTNFSQRGDSGGGWVRVGSSKAMVKAFKDPKTWMPATAAVLIGATGSDEKISNWAAKHNPVYGSQQGAQKASDSLRTMLASSAVVTSFIAPSNHESWMPGRSGSLATVAMSTYTTSMFTNALKDSTGRARPNGVDERSFPSSHSAAASTYATLSAQRVNDLPLSLRQRRTLKTGFHVIAGATAWARVEAQAHYPVDVLTGFALGNFIAVLMQESMQGAESPVWVGVDLDPNSEVPLFRIGFTF